MIKIARDCHGETYATRKFEQKFLVDWVYEDCSPRWGASREDIEKIVEDIL